MGFEGDLESINLPDLLQLLSSARKTGALSIRRGTQEKRLYFRDGLLVYASSTDEYEKLGNVLVREGLVTAEEIARCRRHQAETGRRFGITLLELGCLSHSSLIAGLKTQARLIITNLFRWWGGHFDFAEEGVSWPNEVAVGFDVQAILMDAATAVDEWNRIRDVLPDLDVVLEIAPAPAKGSPVQFGDDEWHVLSLVDGRRAVTDIAAESNLTDIATCLILGNLLKKGILRIAPDKKRERTAPPPVRSPAASVIQVYNELIGQVGYAVRESVGPESAATFHSRMQEYCEANPLFFKGAWDPKAGRMDGDTVLANLITQDPEERDEALAAAAFGLFRYALSLSASLLSRPSQAALIGDLQPLAALLLKNHHNQLIDLGVRRALSGFLSPTDVAYGDIGG